MAEKKKMSVADILAAARKADGGAGGAAPASEPAAPEPESTAPAEPIEEAAAPPSQPKAPAPKVAPGQRPSVADILALARANKTAEPAKPAEAKAKPQPKSEAKPAAKPAAAAKTAVKEKAPAARLDTSSVLAAARAGRKPGPVSKADAPQKSEKTKAAPAAKLSVPPAPQKPDYALAKPGKVPAADKKTDGKKTESEARRTFVFLGVLFGTWMAAGFTALATVGGLWTLAFARFMFPNFLTEPPSKFKVGFPDEFPPGQVSEKFKAQFGVWVVNYEYKGQGEIFALASICTHLGCTPNWLESEQKFKCPCHGSGFYKDGINFEGPAPRPLERYAIRMAEDGQLEIDKSRKFQEELGQWEDAASFVNV
jgi:cytochrome b6-f complex iron-sulfur subunit